MSSELLPAVLASVPPPSYPQRSLDAAKNDYGCELTTPSPPLRMLLRGSYPTADIMRWHQANQFVTSGANPGGGQAGFNDAHKQWSVRVREESVTLALADTLSDVVVRESMPLSDALQRAAKLATRIRGYQTLRDGNHRSGLLCFVLSLAEARVLLRPDFSIYRAYIILSAREHPNNRDNVLIDDAFTDTSAALFRYARRRVKPGEPDFEYLAAWSETIRRLPLHNAHIESIYKELHRSTITETSEEKVRGRMERWARLSEEEQRHVKLAHPTFTPGSHHGRRKWPK